MKALICECCGGRIDRNTMTCNFCGVQYKFDDNFAPIIVKKIDPRFETVTADCFVGNEVFMANNCMEAIADAIRRNLTEKIMNELEQYVDIIQEDDPLHCGKKYYARIRICKPDYRFGDVY